MNMIRIHKTDVIGRPVQYVLLRNFHPHQLTDDKLWLFIFWHNLMFAQKYFPKNADNYIVIYDLHDAGMKNINMH